MATLDELQGRLSESRDARRAAELQRIEARARLQAAQDEGDEQSVAKLAGDARLADAARRESVAREAALVAELGDLGDPRQLVESLGDDVPFLLFPVRLETRFKQVGGGHQLWLRIYPDDCQVETFTEVMSDSELAATRDFWIGWWKAGGVEAQQRAAWRGLVGSHGSGRAAWLVKAYKPQGTPPPKAKPEDVILVVDPEIDPTAAERNALETYWIAVWKAGNDATAREAARATLVSAVGDPDRARALEEGWRPANLSDDPPPPHTRQNVTVTIATVDLPPKSGVVTTRTSWNQAPRVSTLPDRFVAIGIRGGQEVFAQVGRPVPSVLPVGPDPSLPEADQIRSQGGELTVNEELRWLTDFDAAVDRGMGMRIDLHEGDATAGFDRLIVLGLRLSSDAEHGAADLERLLEDHKSGKNGLSVLPQGTPTNNTGDAASGYTWLDDPEGSYDRVFGSAAELPPSSDPLERRDGEYLAGALGIDAAVLQGVPHADGLDQAEARAANAALWPATWGYFLEEMLSLPDPAVQVVREFFLRYVSGRGAIPPLRVGQQPYGILPATVWSRLELARGERGPHIAATGPALGVLTSLQGVLRRLDQEWRAAEPRTAWADKPGEDPHQALLDVVGLFPDSAEYHQRYARSLSHLFNLLRLAFGDWIATAVVDAVRTFRRNALAQLGLDPSAELPILDKIFDDPANPLHGPLVDDAPASETRPVRPYAADGSNYIAWLQSASLDEIRREDLGPDKPAPQALLYSLLRHATMLAYWDASIELLLAVVTSGLTVRREANFLQVSTVDAIGSKFEPLYQQEPAATAGEQVPIAEYLDRPSVLATRSEAARLAELKNALGVLAKAPTARLERLLAEHCDVCTYRLDAWKLGLVHLRLEEQRARRPRGVYLGAFGWLEDVRREAGTLTPVELPPDLAQVFAANGGAPLVRDSANAGHMHAPSVDQAAAAAILRNGYITHATPAEAETLQVDLSSERVRTALGILAGQRRGQSLAAMLGYQLERGLHDRYGLGVGSVDRFILYLRHRFPLVANKLQSTAAPGTPVEQLEARNVVDGLALAEHVRTTGQKSYPFGIPTGTQPGQLPPAAPDEAAAIDAEVDRLLDSSDAVADVMTAESVYQVVRGASERAAAAADVVGRGHFPPEPEVVQTPRSGLTVVHRVGIHLDAGATAPAGATPRAAAEPALAKWVAGRLPAPAHIGCAVTYTDASGAEQSTVVTLAQIGLEPLDLVHVTSTDPRQAGAELDDRIEHHVRTTVARHPGAAVRIEYTQPVADHSLFELGPLLRDLHALTLRSRALEAADMALPTAQTDVPPPDTEELATRIEDAIAALSARVAPLAAAAADNATAADPYLHQVVDLLLATGLHGVPATGTSGLYERVGALYAQAAGKLQVVVDRWDRQDAEYQAILATVPGLATEEERQKALQRAERLVSTQDTFPLPASAAYQPIVAGKKTAFDTALQALRAPLTANVTSLGDFLALLPPALALIPAHDRVPFDQERKANDVAPEVAALATLRDEARRRVAGVHDDVQARVTAATDLVAQARANSDLKARANLLQEAAGKVLGDDVRMLPRFTFFPVQAGELAAAHAAGPDLLQHLVTSGRRFPVDDWMYGVARAREKLAHWEGAAVLAEAIGKPPAELTPLQLPYRDHDSWAALELPDDYLLDGEKLLYSAAFGGAFDPTHVQCGLLVDEWTEIVPAGEETTGLAFNFDQPNSEPPQAMLLVTPPVLTGAWRWQDLQDALGDALDSARGRLVEPQHLEDDALGQFLPATMMALTYSLITIAVDLKVQAAAS
jgi:hypothetical protein